MTASWWAKILFSLTGGIVATIVGLALALLLPFPGFAVSTSWLIDCLLIAALLGAAFAAACARIGRLADELLHGECPHCGRSRRSSILPMSELTNGGLPDSEHDGATDAPPEDESRIAAWYAAKYLKCASCGTPETVKLLVFRLPNGGGDLCAECAKPVIESTRAIEDLLARKRARAGGSTG